MPREMDNPAAENRDRHEEVEAKFIRTSDERIDNSAGGSTTETHRGWLDWFPSKARRRQNEIENLKRQQQKELELADKKSDAAKKRRETEMRDVRNKNEAKIAANRAECERMKVEQERALQEELDIKEAEEKSRKEQADLHMRKLAESLDETAVRLSKETWEKWKKNREEMLTDIDNAIALLRLNPIDQSQLLNILWLIEGKIKVDIHLQPAVTKPFLAILDHKYIDHAFGPLLNLIKEAKSSNMGTRFRDDLTAERDRLTENLRYAEERFASFYSNLRPVTTV